MVRHFQVINCQTRQGFNDILIYSDDFKLQTFTDKNGFVELDFTEVNLNVNICFKSINIETYCIKLSDLIYKTEVCVNPTIIFLDSIEIVEYQLSNKEILKRAILNYKNVNLSNDTFKFKLSHLEYKNLQEISKITCDIFLCIDNTFNFFNDLPLYFSNFSESHNSNYLETQNFKFIENLLFPLNLNESLLGKNFLNKSENWNKEIVQDSLGKYIRFYFYENNKIVFDCLIDLFTYDLFYFRFCIHSKSMVKVSKESYDWKSELVWNVYFDRSIPKIPMTVFFSANTYFELEDGIIDIRKSVTQFRKVDYDFVPNNVTSLNLKY